MKKTVFLLTWMLALVATASLAKTGTESLIGSKKVVKVYKNVKNFERIAVYGSVDVKYIQGKTAGVTVKGKKDAVDRITVMSDGKTLTISTKKYGGIIQMSVDNAVTVYVTSPDLISVTMRGSGDFEATDLDTDVLDINILGSGDVEFKHVICDEFHADVKGSGDVELKSVECLKSTLSIKGSGDIKVNYIRSQSVDASILGSGDITIKGKPGKVRQSVRGSGDISVE